MSPLEIVVAKFYLAGESSMLSFHRNGGKIIWNERERRAYLDFKEAEVIAGKFFDKTEAWYDKISPLATFIGKQYSKDYGYEPKKENI